MNKGPNFDDLTGPAAHLIGYEIGFVILFVLVSLFVWSMKTAFRPDRYFTSSSDDKSSITTPAAPRVPVAQHPGLPGRLWAPVTMLDELIKNVSWRPARRELEDVRRDVKLLYRKDLHNELMSAEAVAADIMTIASITERLIGIQMDNDSECIQARSKALANIQARGENIHAWVRKANQRNIAMIDSYDEINHGIELQALRELR